MSLALSRRRRAARRPPGRCRATDTHSGQAPREASVPSASARRTDASASAGISISPPDATASSIHLRTTSRHRCVTSAKRVRTTSPGLAAHIVDREVAKAARRDAPPRRVDQYLATLGPDLRAQLGHLSEQPAHRSFVSVVVLHPDARTWSSPSPGEVGRGPAGIAGPGWVVACGDVVESEAQDLE